MRYLIAGERMALLLEKHRQSVSRSPELSILGARNGDEVIELHLLPPRAGAIFREPFRVHSYEKHPFRVRS